jgi:hypothetical protein
MRSGSNERSSSAAAPECTADLEFASDFSTTRRVWTSRIDFPDKEPPRQAVDQSTKNNEEVRHFEKSSFERIVAHTDLSVIMKVLKVVSDGFKELCVRFDTLEANLRETLRKTNTDLKANTTELESLSAMMRQSHPGFHKCDSQAEMKPDARPSSQDLLRRLKRGYLLQYDCDDDDDLNGRRSTARAENFFDVLKREVAIRTSDISSHAKRRSKFTLPALHLIISPSPQVFGIREADAKNGIEGSKIIHPSSRFYAGHSLVPPFLALRLVPLPPA